MTGFSHTAKEKGKRSSITVYRIARNSLLTLGHEFAHLVDDLAEGGAIKPLSPPDEAGEKKFDDRARRDLTEFRAQNAR